MHGRSLYWSGQCTHPFLHRSSLGSSGDCQETETFSYWILLDKQLLLLTLYYNSMWPTETGKHTRWSTSAIQLLCGMFFFFFFLPDIAMQYVSVHHARAHTHFFNLCIIFCRYLKSHFIIDFLGCLPWDIIYGVIIFVNVIVLLFTLNLTHAIRFYPLLSS